MSEDYVKTLNTFVHHRLLVREGLQKIIYNLEHGALMHDESKFREDEFDGFSRINRIAREHPYGSKEYKEALRKEKPVIQKHYQRNRHHPEHFETVKDMTFLDIIEMVVDWWAAWKVYDGQRDKSMQSTWKENIDKQKERYKNIFNKSEWWFIEQVADFLGSKKI